MYENIIGKKINKSNEENKTIIFFNDLFLFSNSTNSL